MRPRKQFRSKKWTHTFSMLVSISSINNFGTVAFVCRGNRVLKGATFKKGKNMLPIQGVQKNDITLKTL